MGKLQGVAEIEAPILVLFQKLRDNGVNIDLSLLEEVLDKRNLHIVDLDFLAEEISVKTRGNPVIGLTQVGQAYSSAVMEATKTREGINDAIERGIKIQSGKLNKSLEVALKVFAEVKPDIDFSKLQPTHNTGSIKYVELYTRERIIAELVDGLFKIADGLSSKERIVKQYNDNFVHIQHSISDNPSFLELSASEQNPKPHNVKHYTKHKMHFIKGKGFNIQNDDVRFEIKSVADLKAIRHVKLQESIAALEAKHGDDRSIEKLASLIRAGGSMTFGEVIASVNALKLEPAARKKVNQSVDSNIATHMQSAEDGLSNAESHVNKALEMRTTQQPGQKNVLQKSKSVNIINTDNKATAQDMSKNTLQKSKSMDDAKNVKEVDILELKNKLNKQVGVCKTTLQTDKVYSSISEKLSIFENSIKNAKDIKALHDALSAWSGEFDKIYSNVTAKKMYFVKQGHQHEHRFAEMHSKDLKLNNDFVIVEQSQKLYKVGEEALSRYIKYLDGNCKVKIDEKDRGVFLGFMNDSDTYAINIEESAVLDKNSFELSRIKKGTNKVEIQKKLECKVGGYHMYNAISVHDKHKIQQEWRNHYALKFPYGKGTESFSISAFADAKEERGGGYIKFSSDKTKGKSYPELFGAQDITFTVEKFIACLKFDCSNKEHALATLLLALAEVNRNPLTALINMAVIDLMKAEYQSKAEDKNVFTAPNLDFYQKCQESFKKLLQDALNLEAAQKPANDASLTNAIKAQTESLNDAVLTRIKKYLDQCNNYGLDLSKFIVGSDDTAVKDSWKKCHPMARATTTSKEQLYKKGGELWHSQDIVPEVKVTLQQGEVVVPSVRFLETKIILDWLTFFKNEVKCDVYKALQKLDSPLYKMFSLIVETIKVHTRSESMDQDSRDTGGDKINKKINVDNKKNVKKTTHLSIEVDKINLDKSKFKVLVDECKAYATGGNFRKSLKVYAAFKGLQEIVVKKTDLPRILKEEGVSNSIAEYVYEQGKATTSALSTVTCVKQCITDDGFAESIDSEALYCGLLMCNDLEY